MCELKNNLFIFTLYLLSLIDIKSVRLTWYDRMYVHIKVVFTLRYICELHFRNGSFGPSRNV